jgi:porphobilinogen synthase
LIGAFDLRREIFHDLYIQWTVTTKGKKSAYVDTALSRGYKMPETIEFTGVIMRFPEYRPRRLRKNEAFRRMIRETSLDVSNFILPLFVVEGKGIKNPLVSMPGHFQFSPDTLVKEARLIAESGIPAVILFGIPSRKDGVGSQAYARDGITQKAVKNLKDAIPELMVITDVCLCEYTDHGHCGIISNHDVDNDPTLDVLAKVSISHVQAGADMVAPSDMMDGRVSAIREALDESGYESVPIMAYSAKYCSAFYGPFRDAAQSAPQFGDRKSYQMDPANADEALREVELDIDEGADIVMVKPALSYLDIIWRVKTSFNRPVAAYNVSGEYSMLKAAAQNGWVDETRCMLEILTSIKRAGADLIITYHALEAARALKSSPFKR